MSRIQEIWQQLDGQTGVFRRVRYDAISPCDLYLGLKMPEADRLLALHLPIGLAKGTKPKPPVQGIRVEKIADQSDGNRFFLNVVLTNPLFTHLFDALLTDLIGRLLPITDPAQSIQTLLNQLDNWEAFFSRYSAGGLSQEQQKGLFGELSLLRLLLTSLPNPAFTVDSWVGSEAAIQDFRAANWAIEVKTSSQTTSERMTINGERQLDEQPFDHLFLYYLNVDMRPGGGESLVSLIDTIRQTLNGSVAVLFGFNHKLLKAGYLDAQADLYHTHGYVVRDHRFFRVSDGFPRITPTDLRPGVGEVHYSASLSACLPFQTTQQYVFSFLTQP